MSRFSDVIAAYDYSAKCHANQRRKDVSKTPYINHPIEVAQFLALHFVKSRDIIIGAILHDVIEDTSGTAEEIEQKFGKIVRSIVEEVSDDKSLNKVQRKRLQIEHAKHISPEAKLVKLADKYSNVSGLIDNPPPAWIQAEINGYVYWSMAVCRNL
jgi:(p)ppGpp synthase/HD superfamily hydrolase